MKTKQKVLISVSLILTLGLTCTASAVSLYTATVPIFAGGLELHTGAVHHDRTVLVVYFGDIDELEQIVKPNLDDLAAFGPNVNISFDFDMGLSPSIELLTEHLDAMMFIDVPFDDLVLDDAFLAEYAPLLDQSSLLTAIVDFDDTMLVRTPEGEYFALSHFELFPEVLSAHLDVKPVVPEPGTVVLFGLGLLGLMGLIKKKKDIGSKEDATLLLVVALGVSLLLPQTNLTAATIQGVKFHDLNANGVREADEPGLGGETVFIRDNATFVLYQEMTGEDGNYHFERATGGSFWVWSRIPDGWRQTTPVEGTGTLPYPVDVGQDQTITVNFGIYDTDISDNSPPEVSITVNSFVVPQGESAVFSGQFTDADPGDSHTIQWNFGDGNTADTLTTTHVYDAIGEYTVTLTVTDNRGDAGTASSQITVNDEVFEYNFDARIGMTADVAIAPGVSQLIGEDGLREQITDLAISYERTTGAVRSLSNPTGYLRESYLNEETPLSDLEAIALNYIQDHLELLGLSEGDIAGMELTDSVYSQATGATHLYWRQRHQGLPVYNAQLHVNVNRDGRIISVNNSFMPSLSDGFDTLYPAVSAGEAVMSALQDLGIQMSVPPAESNPSEGPQRETVVDHSGISLKPIEAGLMLLPVQLGDVRLVWNFQLFTLDERHAYDLNIDAVNGDVLTRFDWVKSQDYRVYPLPGVESPIHTTPLPPADARTLITPSPNSGSPFGWHDTNGVGGAEFTITRGNSVHAHQPGTAEPDCGTNLACDFSINLAGAPATYTDASVAELFYVTNVIHDVMFEYGFDSPAGNFQESTYGAGGQGGDAVDARAQIANWCNAFWTPAPDGFPPSLSMFICNGRDGVFDHGVVVHEYGHGISTRIVGGPSNVSCLNNNQQPGEGISDWLALVFTHEPGDAGTDARGIGSYFSGQPTIRPQFYSTDPTINTYTYESINGLAVPHGVGSVWAQALWEVYWTLVDQHGFDPNLYDAYGDSGNQRMLLYFTEGLKNTACSPTFTDARDGIIQAAVDNHNGDDVCLIWNAFAQFGLGVDAVSGGANSTTPTNGFQIPIECAAAACDAPSVRSRNSGDWHTNTTWERFSGGSWSSGTNPGTDDIILIRDNHLITAQAAIDTGTLCIAEDGVLEVRDNPTPLMVEARNIYNDGTIRGQDGNPGRCEGSSPGSSLFHPPTAGSSVDLWVNQHLVNDGLIEAGSGGHAITYGVDSVDDTSPCPRSRTITAEGGAGGFVQVNADRILNNGTIGPAGANYYQNEMVYAHGGNGGVGSNSYRVVTDCPGLPSGGYQGNLGDPGYNWGPATGGNGGNTTVNGTNELVNAGRISSGYGGDARTYTCSQNPVPGEGGTAVAYSSGLRIPGTIDGGGGKVVAEPEILLAGRNMRIENSREVLIFGGDEWHLNLRNLGPNAITAEETITLAVGENGVIDLRGNCSAILQAGTSVDIFSDTILLDPGVTLADVIDAPAIETHASRILYEVALSGSSSLTAEPGATVTMTVQILNSGPVADTYTLTLDVPDGWSVGTVPETITVEGLQTARLDMDVTFPDIPGASDLFSITAVSQADSTVMAAQEIRVATQPAYLTISKSGDGSGLVMVGEQECDAACPEMKIPYADHTAIVLKAIPETGSYFMRWEDESGNEIGLGEAFRVEADDTVIAVFGR